MDKQLIKNVEPKTLESLVKKQQWEEKVNKELRKISDKYFPESKEDVKSK